MILEQVELPGNILKLRLKGALDIAGSQEIGASLGAIVGKNDRVIVDFGAVTFLASLGVRTLVASAKAISRDRGKMVIANAQRNVAEALKTAGIDALIPLVPDLNSANALLN